MCVCVPMNRTGRLDKAVNAHLALEIAVCILALDEQNCGFETRLVAVRKSSMLTLKSCFSPQC